MASSILNYNIDSSLHSIESTLSSFVCVSIKMVQGYMISITIPSDITIKQFYEFVWRLIPERIALQCLDLFRIGSDEPLLPTSTLLYPQKDEVFVISIEIHPHLSLRVDFESNVCDKDKFYQSFEVLIYICFPTQLESIETDITQRKMNDGLYYHPTDQEGRPIPHGARHKAKRYCFFARDEMIDNKCVTTFYFADENQFIQPIIGGAEYDDDNNWMITMDENAQRLERLGDLFKDLLPASKKERAILSQAIEDEWSKMENRQ